MKKFYVIKVWVCLHAVMQCMIIQNYIGEYTLIDISFCVTTVSREQQNKKSKKSATRYSA